MKKKREREVCPVENRLVQQRYAFLPAAAAAAAAALHTHAPTRVHVNVYTCACVRAAPTRSRDTDEWHTRRNSL